MQVTSLVDDSRHLTVLARLGVPCEDRHEAQVCAVLACSNPISRWTDIVPSGPCCVLRTDLAGRVKQRILERQSSPFAAHRHGLARGAEEDRVPDGDIGRIAG